MANSSMAQSGAPSIQSAKPSSAYKSRAWLAMLGLTVFMALYFALSAWFLLTAYRLTFGSSANSGNAFWGWVIGACAAFLAVFMLKAIFFVKHGGTEGSVEVTAVQQPELFRFLYALADQVGAPRPHKVFVSPRVNAAVFYDLSLLNLFFPSKKNLEIGLGLVNALTLGEFRAVLAHEFGHFAQRAMAVGRWVYVAQQIAAHLVARRDALDDFLRTLSRLDIRLAWVGWLLSLIVWSIRSLVESAFRAVLLMQRALSREMEMNADLVAVSVTGSDALIHALHRLNAADDAWTRSVNFVAGEHSKGKRTSDMFAIQTEIVGLMGGLLNKPDYGATPAPGTQNAQAHRVFKVELAQVPQMWLTHPLNHDREANAKRNYVAAEIDPRSAWELFADAQALRSQVTAQLPGADADAQAVSMEESLQELRRQFGRVFFKSCYRGVYFGRSIVRSAAEPSVLLQPAAAPIAADLDALYPESLAADMEQLRTLERERAQLRAIESGGMHPTGGVIVHRGVTLPHKMLSPTLRSVESELTVVRERLQAHDQRCRSLHFAAAQQLGGAWDAYLQGLLAGVHYADHTEANLRDLQRLLANTVAMATATRKVNDAGIARILKDGSNLHGAIDKVFLQAKEVQLDATLLQSMAVESWSQVLGELKLLSVSRENVANWLKVVDSWVDHTAGACSSLRNHALEQLLLSEDAIGTHLREGTQPQPACAASRFPKFYDTLVLGAERPLQTRLDLWGRFQTADGFFPTAARLLVAGGIVAAVLGLGGRVGSSTVTVYNGLARPVLVHMGPDQSMQVSAFGTNQREMAAGQKLRMEAYSTSGELVESFDAEVSSSFGQYVYNVASAAPLMEWTANYGNAAARPEHLLGAPRWTTSAADHLFEEPPKSISSKSGGGTKLVLAGMADLAPQRQVGILHDASEQQRLVLAHARWDPLDSRNTGQWLAMASGLPEFNTLLAARLKQALNDVVLLRLELDRALPEARAQVCQRHQAMAAAAPSNADLEYVALRCQPEGPELDKAFIAGLARHPDHGWFAFAAGHAQARSAQWRQAMNAYAVARRAVPMLTDSITVDMARMQRLVQQDDRANLSELSKSSDSLRQFLALETGQDVGDSPYKAYSELAAGKLDQAVQRAKAAAPLEARVLRLAAASDGASAAVVARAKNLPAEQGLDESTVWASLGLAARDQANLSEFKPALQFATVQQVDALLHFAAASKSAANATDAERWLNGLPPELRGHGYSVGVIVLGTKAPRVWRDRAKQLLFASERPYFS